MNKKRTLLFLASLVLVIGVFLFSSHTKTNPITITLDGVLPEMTLDQKIYASETILIGEVDRILPSKWNTLQEIDTKKLSPSEIQNLDFGMFTDIVVTPRKFLKGSLPDNFVLRVRSFSGKIEQVTYKNRIEPEYRTGQIYLFLLQQYRGPEKYIDPGFYLPVNSGKSVFLIEDGKAMSSETEWVLDDLIKYIELSPWALTEPNIPEDAQTQEIVKTIETAYDIKSKAGYDFDTGNLSSVFVNDPRFVVMPEKLVFTRHFTDSLNLDSPGYLDYEIAFYHWWSEYLGQYNNTEWTDKWGAAWAAEKSPIRERTVQIVSIEIGKEFSTVYLYDGLKLAELYLVNMHGQWFVAGEKDVTSQLGGQSTDLYLETPLPSTETPVETATSTP